VSEYELQSQDQERVTPDGRPSWQRKMSENVALLTQEAVLLETEWNRRFGPDAWENGLFVQAFARALSRKEAFPLLELVHRASPGAHEDPPAADFLQRYGQSVQALSSETGPGEAPVPISLFSYLTEALRQATEQKESPDVFPSPEAADHLLALGRELLEDPELSAFRRDILEAFPSTLGAGTPVSSEAALPPPPQQAALLDRFIGTTFRDYRITGVLGRGGFGAVFQAAHTSLPGIVRALKIFLDVDRTGPGFKQFREECLAEARVQALLKHPNIVEIVDVFEDQGYVVLVMEFIRGGNLAGVISARKASGTALTPAQVLSYAIPVCRGVAQAHRAGIVHRDIKPQNILLGDLPKVADFGLARHLEESGQRRHTLGRLVGTPLYMAPEQVAGKAKSYDHRCDLYSLGVVLYELSLGLPPFEHEDPFKVLEMHETEVPESLALKIDGFPEELDLIILKCLEKRPADRFGSAEELGAALEECERHLTAGTGGPSKPDWERRRRAAGRKLLGTLGALLLLVLAGGLGYPLVSPWLAARAASGGRIASPAPKEAAPGKAPAPAPPSTLPKPQDLERSKRDPEAREASAPSPLEKADQKVETAPEAARTVPPPPRSLREQLVQVPMTTQEVAFLGRILDLFSAHRAELVERRYDALEQDLAALASLERTPNESLHLEAARDLVGLSSELVQERWKELSESKDLLVLHLADGIVIQGRVDRADKGRIRIADGRGGHTDLAPASLAPEEFLRGRTVAAAELAYQALSGDAGKALEDARDLEKRRKQVLLGYPVFVRLAHLAVGEQVPATLALAEAPLGRREPREAFEKELPRYPGLLSTLRALRRSEADLCGVYPFLSGEFRDAAREGEALELVLGARYSRALESYPGTQAEKLAATLFLAEFLAALEPAHDELMARRGWLNYTWELRPDEAGIPERTEFWDLLGDGGSVLRDPKGPRSLIMGRPHPRSSEGILIRYEFEPLGDDPGGAEWRFNLRREGGGASYLRFDPQSISLRSLALGAATGDEILVTGKIPGATGPERTHTCVLVPGTLLHVFLDGTLALSLNQQDARLPSQPSFVVMKGKLSIRSIQVLKKAPR